MTNYEAIQFLDNMKHEEVGRAMGNEGFYAELMGYHVKALNMAIKALEQTRWIPVSERLPEIGSEVLVCFDFKGKRSVYISNFYGDGEFHGLDDEYLTPEGRRHRKAVAWMPLPEPYRESEDNEDIPMEYFESGGI